MKPNKKLVELVGGFIGIQIGVTTVSLLIISIEYFQISKRHRSFIQFDSPFSAFKYWLVLHAGLTVLAYIVIYIKESKERDKLD